MLIPHLPLGFVYPVDSRPVIVSHSLGRFENTGAAIVSLKRIAASAQIPKASAD
jgi:hypothetical protein